MNDQGGNYVAVLRQRVEEDIAKQMGKPIHNRYYNVQVFPFINLLRYLWTCLVLDFLLVQIVIGPFTVAIWRGAWELYDDIFLVRGQSYCMKFPLQYGLFLRACWARTACMLALSASSVASWSVL